MPPNVAAASSNAYIHSSWKSYTPTNKWQIDYNCRPDSVLRYNSTVSTFSNRGSVGINHLYGASSPNTWLKGIGWNTSAWFFLICILSIVPTPVIRLYIWVTSILVVNTTEKRRIIIWTRRIFLCRGSSLQDTDEQEIQLLYKIKQNNKDARSVYAINKIKLFWFLAPIALFVHGQKWSILLMQRPLILSWWAKGGL